MKKYLFHYHFQGKKWGFDVYANSQEEAVQKVKAISQAIYDGECMMEIHLPENPLSKIARLIRSLLPKSK